MLLKNWLLSSLFIQFNILFLLIVEVLYYEQVTEIKFISFSTACHDVNVVQRFSGFLAIRSNNITKKDGILSHLVIYNVTVWCCFSNSPPFLYNVSHCNIRAYNQGGEWLFWSTLMFHIKPEVQRSNNKITINEIIIMMFHIIHSVHYELNYKLYEYQQMHYSLYCIHH